MPQAPDRFQPANTNPARPGFADSPNHFWKALEGVVNGLRGFQGAKANPNLFHEPTMTAASSVGPAMQGGLDVMADPRNAWMGMGPVAGMALMGKGIRGAGNTMRELGGFNVPTSTMRQAMDMPRPNTRVGASGNEPQVRETFHQGLEQGHKLADVLMNVNHPLYGQATEFYQGLPMNSKEDINKIMGGMEQLSAARRPNAIDGGGVVPPWKFGQ